VLLKLLNTSSLPGRRETGKFHGMVWIARPDADTLRRTEASGFPVHLVVEEDIPAIEIITDENGVPTKGGLIGYALAYTLMVGFIGYFFYFIP